VSEIVDHGFSGGSDKRPGLKQLRTLVHNREVDAVVVLKLDRLFRSLRHLLTTLEEFQTVGVQFVAVRDQIDYTSASGRLFISLLGSFAQFEKDLCRERTLLGLQHAKSKGKILGRPQKHSKSHILTLRQHGHSYRQIQKRTGAPTGCIARALKSARKSGTKNEILDPKNSTSCTS
jgi:DNA invertase Pin-like site-specific DNA recombinase